MKTLIVILNCITNVAGMFAIANLLSLGLLSMGIYSHFHPYESISIVGDNQTFLIFVPSIIAMVIMITADKISFTMEQRFQKLYPSV